MAELPSLKDVSARQGLRELFHPQLDHYGPEFKRSLYKQATLPLFVALAAILIATTEVFLYTILENINTYSLDEYFEYALGFVVVILILHFVVRHDKFDYYALFAVIVVIASVAIISDLERIAANDNRYGVLIVMFLFIGMLFMPYRPYVPFLLGCYCAALVVFLALFSLEPAVNEAREGSGHPWLLLSLYAGQYFVLGLVVAVFRAFKMHFYIRSYLKDRRLLLAEEDLDAARSLLLRSESQYIEFKSSARYDYRIKKLNKDLEQVIVKAIAGFMNSEGGTLVIGVDDDGNPLGIEKDLESLRRKDLDGYEQLLISLVSQNLGREYCSNLRVSFFREGEKDICIVRILPNSKPVFAKSMENAFYVRTGNNTQRLDTREAMEYIDKHFQI